MKTQYTIQLGELWHQRLTPNQLKSLPNSVGMMILLSLRRHLLVRARAVSLLKGASEQTSVSSLFSTLTCLASR